jgi:hypothetical protein
MLHRLGSTSYGLSTVGIDRPSRIASWTRLRQLRRHRVGAGFLRDGRDGGAGVRAHESRGRCRRQFLRYRECVRRPQAGRPVADGEGSGGPAAAVSSKVFNPVGSDRTIAGCRAGTSCSRWTRARRGCRPIARHVSIHEPDPETPLEETVALDEVVRMGKVLYVGASNIEAWRLARGCGSATSMASRVSTGCRTRSLLDRHAEREMFPHCADQVSAHAVQPVAGGWLTGSRSAGSHRRIADDAAA